MELVVPEKDFEPEAVARLQQFGWVEGEDGLLPAEVVFRRGAQLDVAE